MSDETGIDLEYRPRLKDLIWLEDTKETEFSNVVDTEAEEDALERGPRVTPAEHFEGREGYDAAFLGDFVVDMPVPNGARANDVLKIPDYDNQLNYQHFSVVMSESRKLAMFVGVNIDGEESKSIKRGRDKWFLDGRIPIEAQHGEALYDDNGLDRGHLVRREDPNWGGLSTAETANADTFHFTNCSPQMAGFNQQIWLGLENYILKNTRRWKTRVTVFTGPVFGENDLEYRDTRIPLAYWKVIAFVHFNGKPSASAYMIYQQRQLRDLEAAFGRYKTFQLSVKTVEKLTDLRFGNLFQFDGFSNEELAAGQEQEMEITTFNKIRV